MCNSNIIIFIKLGKNDIGLGWADKFWVRCSHFDRARKLKFYTKERGNKTYMKPWEFF